MNYHVFYIVLLAFLIGAVSGALVERSAQEKLRKQKNVFLDEYEKYKNEFKPVPFTGYAVKEGLRTGDFRERNELTIIGEPSTLISEFTKPVDMRSIIRNYDES